MISETRAARGLGGGGATRLAKTRGAVLALTREPPSQRNGRSTEHRGLFKVIQER
jgi:hypothetical protein